MKKILIPASAAVVALAVSLLMHATVEAQTSADAPDCDYAIAIVDQEGCSPVIVWVDDLPPGGDAVAYNGSYIDRDGNTWAIRCVHYNHAERLCVLGELIAAAAPRPQQHTPAQPPVAPAQPPAPELAFTGAETSTLGYVGVGLIASGLVALRSRRKFSAGDLN